MKTIQEMRERYWSGVKTLWPAKSSKVAVPFCWEGFNIDNKLLVHAQSLAKCGFFGKANYYLTGAYCGEPKNEAFWNQFI